MHLRSKLTSEICPNIGGLDGKTKQNRLKAPNRLCLSEKPLYLLKNNTHLSFFKNKYSCKFCVFMIKNAFGNES